MLLNLIQVEGLNDSQQACEGGCCEEEITVCGLSFPNCAGVSLEHVKLMPIVTGLAM